MAKRRKKSKKQTGKFWKAIFYLIVWGLAALGVLEAAPEILPGMIPGDSTATTEGGLTIHFIDVGQADAAVVMCGGETLMIDGGNAADSSLIYAYLTRTLGLTHIDYMIATHPHEDHIGGLPGALNACTVGTVYSPVAEHDTQIFETLKTQAAKQGVGLTVPAVGSKFTVGTATVQFISPAKQFEDTNDWSLVVRIVYGDTSFLFTGDAGWDAEHEMVNSGYNLSANVLKVGHHGSDSSSSYVFLREVMPEYAIISVGEGNSYGHPTQAALSRLHAGNDEADGEAHIAVDLAHPFGVTLGQVFVDSDHMDAPAGEGI